MEQRRLPIFAERFSQLRAERTQKEFADFLEISRPTVGFYENGTRLPDALVLRQIAEKCNVSADWLLGLSNYQDSKSARFTVEDVGLSEQAAKSLIGLSRSSATISATKISVLNLMLEDDAAKGIGTQLLRYLADYLSAPAILDQLIQFTHNEVKIVRIDPDSSEDFPPNCELANMLYDKALIERITQAVDGTRFQFRNSAIANDMYKEDSEDGKPQDND